MVCFFLPNRNEFRVFKFALMGLFYIQQYANENVYRMYIEFETHKNEICFKTLESSAFQLSFEYRMLYLQIKNAVEYCTSI